jgi:hypothetical protein
MKTRLLWAGLFCVVAVSMGLLGCEQAGDSVSGADQMDCVATCESAREDGSCALAAAGAPAGAPCEAETKAGCAHDGCPADCAVHNAEGAETACKHATAAPCDGKPEACSNAHKGTSCSGHKEAPCEGSASACAAVHDGSCPAGESAAAPNASGGCPKKAAGMCPTGS